MSSTKIIAVTGILGVCIMAFGLSCTKTPIPSQPPIHDTVTVIKKDTVRKTDTLYATKPDSTVNLTKGLLVYLPFSGNIADSSGNGNPTQAVGNVLTYDAHGYANNAFGATGHGEKIYVTNNGSIKFDTAFSLSFGFTTYDTVRAQTYISLINHTTGQAPSFTVGNVLPGTRGLIWGTEDESVGCSGIGRNDNYCLSDTTGFQPIPGAWYNVVGIYHNGSAQLYINGKLISSKHGLGVRANNCPTSQVVIGNWWDGNPPDNSQNMNGKLDNVRLYNRVLTPHEIALLSSNYQVTSNSVKPPLRSH